LPPMLEDDAEVARRLEQLAPLADRPNVAVKIGPLPCYTAQDPPYPRLQLALARVLGWFGAARVFWCSDLSRLPGSYGDLVGFYRRELTFLSPADRELLLGRALVGWLGWPVPGRPGRA